MVKLSYWTGQHAGHARPIVVRLGAIIVLKLILLGRGTDG